MVKSIQDIMNAVDSSTMMTLSLSEWRDLLSNECQVYVFGENYLAKRFDAINYKFCEKNEAREVLIDNLFALLRYKYFPQSSEEIDDRIELIIKSFTMNLKTTLKKVSFDKNTDCVYLKMLPDYTVAFRNGVFNFKENKWLFKYDIINLEKLHNKIYSYSNEYAIFWYLDYEFAPFQIDISKTSLEDFVVFMRETSKTSRNYCFELIYNMSHNSVDDFDFARFSHLCQILGYSVLQSFSQYFVFLIGSGQNGKNSLFDGCFTNRVIPRPASNNLDSIEEDRFITGALENKSHNIFLESSAKTYTESKMIKALTGSMYQTIEQKGISKYSGVINCKYIFAGNDQEKIKFSDTTTGFKRRINMFEIWYRWDSQKSFLKRGDYFDTTFSDSLNELKDDTLNTSAYIYFAMYGIMLGTKNFEKNFQFTYNDWNETYTEIDIDLKSRISSLSITQFVQYLKSSQVEDANQWFYSTDKNRLYKSKDLISLGYRSFDDMIRLFSDSEARHAFFTDHDVYLSVRAIQTVLRNLSPASTFSSNLKKMFDIQSFTSLNSNKSYVLCNFEKDRLRILKQ